MLCEEAPEGSLRGPSTSAGPGVALTHLARHNLEVIVLGEGLTSSPRRAAPDQE